MKHLKEYVYLYRLDILFSNCRNQSEIVIKISVHKFLSWTSQ